MSLNKTLDRLFDEIRREAKRNPDFADRLDAVLRLHDSRREVAESVLEEAQSDASPQPSAREASGQQLEGDAASKSKRKKPAGEAPAVQATALNPAGLFKREGEDALTAALVALDEAALRALIGEHNLDPAGETGGMDEAELAAHIVAQAKRRAERDEKMFDY